MKIREYDYRLGKRGGVNFYLLIFISVVLITSVTLFSLYKISLKYDVGRMERNEVHLVELQKETILLDFDSIVSGLLLLADHTSACISDLSLADLAIDYKDYSSRTKLYDQVRYMDDTGMEVVRVNFNEGSPSIVPNKRLQNKGSRYYFRDVFILNRGEIFVSPLDLNIEGGKLERPAKIMMDDELFNSIWRPEREGSYSKPMIRFGTPVFDKAGAKRGVLLFNYFGNVLLSKLEQIGINSAGQSLLVNKDGYWLSPPPYDLEWGFMQEYDYFKSANIKNNFPEAAGRIFAEKQGQFYTDRGLFSFNTIQSVKEGMRTTSGSGEAFATSAKNLEADEYIWKVVSYVPSSTLKERASVIFRRLFLVYLAFVAVLGVGVFYYASHAGKKDG